MLQIVQSCSVGISYHLLFSTYFLASIRLLAVFPCVFPFIPEGISFRWRPLAAGFPHGQSAEWPGSGEELGVMSLRG